MKYIVLYYILSFIAFIIFAVLNLVYQFIRACALMIWDLDKAYESEVLMKSKEYKDFEDELNGLL